MQRTIQPFNNYSDAQLWKEIKAGNVTCFDVLYHRHMPALTGQSYKMVNDLALAQDILQDVFTKLYLNRNSIAADTNIGAYLNTAVKHRCLNLLRDQLTRKKHHDALQTQLSGAVQEQPSMYNDTGLTNRVRQHIDNLPGKCREVFLLRYHEHLSYKAIAGQLRLSVKTVEKHISKAMHILRRELKDEHYVLIMMCMLTQ